MADFCIAAKMSPSEYRKLTATEYIAFINALSNRNGSDLEEWL
jgi:hypothetical protein